MLEFRLSGPQDTRDEFEWNARTGPGFFGDQMACRACGCDNLQRLSGEFTFSLPDLKDSKVPPVYICQECWVCMDCGFGELRIPGEKLDLVRKKK